MSQREEDERGSLLELAENETEPDQRTEQQGSSSSTSEVQEGYLNSQALDRGPEPVYNSQQAPAENIHEQRTVSMVHEIMQGVQQVRDSNETGLVTGRTVLMKEKTSYGHPNLRFSSAVRQGTGGRNMLTSSQLSEDPTGSNEEEEKEKSNQRLAECVEQLIIQGGGSIDDARELLKEVHGCKSETDVQKTVKKFVTGLEMTLDFRNQGPVNPTLKANIRSKKKTSKPVPKKSNLKLVAMEPVSTPNQKPSRVKKDTKSIKSVQKKTLSPVEKVKKPENHWVRASRREPKVEKFADVDPAIQELKRTGSQILQRVRTGGSFTESNRVHDELRLVLSGNDGNDAAPPPPPVNNHPQTQTDGGEQMEENGEDTDLEDNSDSYSSLNI